MLMLRWWACMGLVLVMCALAVMRAHRSSVIPPPYVAAILPNCGTACWNDIQPGVTSYKTAREALSALPNAAPDAAEDTWTLHIDSGHQHLVTLNPKGSELQIIPEGVRLGDIVLALGKPDFYTLRFVVVARRVESRFVEIYYVNGRVQVSANLAGQDRLSPDMSVIAIRYLPEAPSRAFDSVDWHGFAQDFAPS